MYLHSAWMQHTLRSLCCVCEHLLFKIIYLKLWCHWSIHTLNFKATSEGKEDMWIFGTDISYFWANEVKKKFRACFGFHIFFQIPIFAWQFYYIYLFFKNGNLPSNEIAQNICITFICYKGINESFFYFLRYIIVLLFFLVSKFFNFLRFCF